MSSIWMIFLQDYADFALYLLHKFTMFFHKLDSYYKTITYKQWTAQKNALKTAQKNALLLAA